MRRLHPVALLAPVLLPACNWSITEGLSGSSSPASPAVLIESDRVLASVSLAPEPGSGLAGAGVLPAAPGLPLADAVLPGGLDLAVVAPLDLPPAAGAGPAGAPPAVTDATAPFVATIDVAPQQFPAGAPLAAEALAPYETVAASPTSFAIDTAVTAFVPGELRVRVHPVGNAALSAVSNALPTASYTVRQVTEEVTDQFGAPWVACAGKLYFPALDAFGADKGFELDDATGATRVAFDLAGAGVDDWSLPLGVFGDRLYLLSRSAVAPGRRLWSFDPATSDLRPVGAHAPGSDTADSDLAFHDGALYFASDVAPHARKLLRLTLDGGGAPLALERLTDLAGPGGTDRLGHLVDAGGALWFDGAAPGGVGGKLFRLDPALGQLDQISDLAPGASDEPKDLTPLGDGLFLTLEDAAGSRELYRAGLTGGTLARVCDLAPGASDEPEDLLAEDGRLWFTARDASGARKLFVLDPAAGTLRQASDTAGPGVADDPRSLVASGSRAWFSAAGPGGPRKLFTTDAETGEWRQVVDLRGSPALDDRPAQLTLHAGKLYFTGIAPAGGQKLFVHDPAGEGAAQLTNLSGDTTAGDSVEVRGVLGAHLYFTALSPGGDVEAFRVCDAATGCVH